MPAIVPAPEFRRYAFRASLAGSWRRCFHYSGGSHYVTHISRKYFSQHFFYLYLSFATFIWEYSLVFFTRRIGNLAKLDSAKRRGRHTRLIGRVSVYVASGRLPFVTHPSRSPSRDGMDGEREGWVSVVPPLAGAYSFLPSTMLRCFVGL